MAQDMGCDGHRLIVGDVEEAMKHTGVVVITIMPYLQAYSARKLLRWSTSDS